MLFAAHRKPEGKRAPAIHLAVDSDTSFMCCHNIPAVIQAEPHILMVPFGGKVWLKQQPDLIFLYAAAVVFYRNDSFPF